MGSAREGKLLCRHWPESVALYMYSCRFIVCYRWSIPATTAALQQTEQSLGDLAQFCEDLVLSQKEFAAKASVYCDNLRINHPSLGGHAPQVHAVDSDWEIVDPRSSDFLMTPSRVGPLLYPGSTLCQAVMALENYYSQTAEAESQRRRMASWQRTGV